MKFNPVDEPVHFEFDADKAVEVLVYLASKSEEIRAFDKYTAGKLIFLADKYHLVRYGRPILGGQYRALDYGPIPQELMDLLRELSEEIAPGSEHTKRLLALLGVDRRYSYPRFSAKGAVNLDLLSRSDLMALDHVIALHGRKSFDELQGLTHATTAYKHAWEERPKGSKMAVMRYEDFFEGDQDALNGAFEEMVENDALQKQFPRPSGV